MANKKRKPVMQQAQVQAQKEQQRRTMLVIAGAVIAVLLIGAGIFAFTRNSTPTPTSIGPGAKCSDVQTFADEGRQHLQPGDPTPVYQTVPPTSGNHDPNPLPAAIYQNPVEVTREVHSLEHGYIIIHYNGISQEELQQLQNIVSGDGYKMILSPYPNMPYKVSMTAWTHMQTCDGVNEAAIRSFMSQFRGQGPEPFGM